MASTVRSGSTSGMPVASSARQKSLRNLTNRYSCDRRLTCAGQSTCASDLPKGAITITSGARGELPDCLTQLAQLRFRLLQPVGHVHFAVHRRRDNEVLPSLRVIARAPMELAKAEVAVSDERAHVAGLGKRQRLVVVGFRALAGIR